MNKPESCNHLQAGNKHYWLIALTLLIIVGSIERIYGIDRQSLWSDELYAVTASYKTSYADIWRLMLGDSHPPGYVSFMYWTLPLVGYTDVGIRLHAFVFGVLWIPLLFWFGCKRFGPIVGILAAAIIASSYNAIYYSQEARAYTMFVVAGIVNLYCFFEILFGNASQRRYRVGFIVTSSAMLYLHYSGFVYICAEGLLYILLWASRARLGSIRECLLLFGVPFLLYVPWIGVMYANLTNAPEDWSVSKAPTLAEVYNTMQRLLGPNDSQMRAYVWLLPATLLCAITEQVKRGFSKKILTIYALFFLMIVPVLAFYIESLIGTPIFEKRYFLLSAVIAMILVAVAGEYFLIVVPDKWKTSLVTLGIVLLTSWMIHTNISPGLLYSKQDKDPVREAVAIIKKDISKNELAKHYTTIMTHDWFEHYLRQSNINFDQDWEGRKYYVPQQISKVDDYLFKHKGKAYLYYLSLRQPNAEAALMALKQEYKLLSQAEVSIEAGTIDVFKFSTREEPDAEQLKSVGTNPSNEIAKIVARDLAQKDPQTYRILMTHDWVQPYLERNGVTIIDADASSYVIASQAGSFDSYLNKNPQVETVYYLALQEPNSAGAAFLLQSRYRLVDEQTVRTSVGNMDVLKFNVKEAPVAADSLRQRMEASPPNAVAQLTKQIIAKTGSEPYAVAMTNRWLEPYLNQNGVNTDVQWEGRFIYTATQMEDLYKYMHEHPELQHLYYVAVLEPNSIMGAAALKTRMNQVCEQGMDLPVGRVVIMQFDSKAAVKATDPEGIPVCLPEVD